MPKLAASSNDVESKLLQHSVSNDEELCTIESFFGNVWEKKPRLFRKTKSNMKTNDALTADVGGLLNVSWQNVADALDSCHTVESKTGSEVLYFRQGVVGSVNGENGQELIAMDKRKEIYNTNFINLL